MTNFTLSKQKKSIITKTVRVMYAIQTSFFGENDKKVMDSFRNTKEEALKAWGERARLEKGLDFRIHYAEFSMYVLLNEHTGKMVELVEIDQPRRFDFNNK